MSEQVQELEARLDQVDSAMSLVPWGGKAWRDLRDQRDKLKEELRTARAAELEADNTERLKQASASEHSAPAPTPEPATTKPKRTRKRAGDATT